jgi:adenosylcobinamide kinase/adenosylcobinamide-phosphate guanylyltransferase
MDEGVGNFIFVIGGARSGKSEFAETLVEAVPGPLVYIATGAAGDEEMARRIDEHKKRRGDRWTSVEEEREVARALGEVDEAHAVLVDCLTLLVSNLMGANVSDDGIAEGVSNLAMACASRKALTVVVSNEVGQGIVPENALARRFRDLQGRANRILAAAAAEVYLVTAGIGQKIK